jgi:hypothetical protein
MVYTMVYTIWYIPYGIYQLPHGIYHPKVVYTMRQPSRCSGIAGATVTELAGPPASVFRVRVEDSTRRVDSAT